MKRAKVTHFLLRKEAGTGQILKESEAARGTQPVEPRVRTGQNIKRK
jgi:hypothetical protein